MNYSPALVGWKAYGLAQFSKLGLFNRPFTILESGQTEERIVEMLENAGFLNQQEVAIRFSKNNEMNLPFYLGKFDLKEIARIISNERADLIPFVHGLVKTVFSASLYFDGKMFFIEVWPGIGGSKKQMFNESPDIIKIDTSIHIAKYLKKRHIENVKGETIESDPFDFSFLEALAKKLFLLKDKLLYLQELQDPLLCDINAESLEDINFMGIQKTVHMDTEKLDIINQDFYVVKTFEDLEKYDGKKELFFDIPMSRNEKQENLEYIIDILRCLPRVYVKSLTMHLAVVLREFDVNIQKGSLNEDYDIQTFDL